MGGLGTEQNDSLTRVKSVQWMNEEIGTESHHCSVSRNSGQGKKNAGKLSRIGH